MTEFPLDRPEAATGGLGRDSSALVAVEVFEATAGDVLQRYGYPVG